MTIERHEVGPRMSQCVVHNDVIYLAGQVDRDASPTAEQQTKNILDRIDALLSTAAPTRPRCLRPRSGFPTCASSRK